jgi:homoserine kinase
VGFDVLGFAFGAVGDRVTVRRGPREGGVVVDAITGVVPDLPRDPARNTASVAIRSIVEARRPDHGFRVSIEKGIPLGSGMGGSAASAVAAVVAAGRLLDSPMGLAEMLHHALAGEAAASGAPHADNAAPCLHGGLTAVVSGDLPEVVSIPVPEGWLAVLVHPHLTIETRRARSVLPADLPLSRHVEQSMRLAGFLVGCFRADAELVSRSMVDLVAEPSRSALIPGFEDVKRAAREGGAFGFGIAGSGPSVFAWVQTAEAAERVEAAMCAAFERHGLPADGFRGPISRSGAVLESHEG